ncbi:MAG: outer membrane protein assembly factor BamB [Candidatus Schmidhempelia sp.]|nr:outer membrane protein assembly factor BamB [Candidatus Schmidhempelia sp.]
MKLLKHLFSSSLMLLMLVNISGCSFGEVDNITVAPSPLIDNQFHLTQRWKNSISGNTKVYSLLSPAYYADMVYVAGREGKIKAINLENGSSLWVTNVAKGSFFSHQSALLSGGVAVDSEKVYVGSERAVIYALNRLTGEIIWQKEAAGEIIASPVSAGGMVLVHTSNGMLQAFNADNGELVWKVDLDVPLLSLRGQSSPAVVSDMVIIGDDNGHIDAMTLKNGVLLWQQRISQPGGSNEIAKLNDVDVIPVITNGIVYAIAYNGNMVSLDIHTGQTLWHRSLGSTHTFTMDNQRIVLVDQNDNIQALAIDSGSELWIQNELSHRRLTNPVIYQDYIVVGDYEGYLYLLDKRTGEFVSKTQVSNSGLLATPMVAGNKLVVQARNGDIYAYEH